MYVSDLESSQIVQESSFSSSQAPSFKEGRALRFCFIIMKYPIRSGYFWHLINEVRFWSLLYSLQTLRLDSWARLPSLGCFPSNYVLLTKIADPSDGSPAQYKNNGEVPIHFSTISVFYIAQTINAHHHHYAFLTHPRPFCSLCVSRLCSHHPWWRLWRREGRRDYHQDKSWTAHRWRCWGWGLKAVSILND